MSLSTPLVKNKTAVAAVLTTLGMAFVVGSALAFEHIGGYIPCALCLLQRNPYYLGIPVGILAILAAVLNLPSWITRGLLAVVMILMIVGGGLGVYHSGVEWGFWEGPASCSVGGAAPAAGSGDILNQLNSVKGPSCTEATLRVLGLSFAGWNVIGSVILAAIAAWGVFGKRH
ncbi:disulfide bond formation protein DsbB [Ciceribacter lividus]|uniref:Disulfide bond formation protein DsbB n=1 Tax=Ciceribacter lividus TaxID=1197950 RepID=A0A6I7HPN2_9HYPH|nr:disulfide bond formation protein B [Ciceribacter lividus]RCW26042.1 disulfide bond formation protein DsbB [Ciceribacter lividus]